MKNIRRIIVVIIIVILSLALATTAFAHPLGNFTINQYVGLNIRAGKVVVDYVVDMAEIPAFQEIAVFDKNGNGQADSSEAANYHPAKCASLQPDLRLLLNDQALDLTLASSSVEFPNGVGGLSTLRLTCNFEASWISNDEKAGLTFTNNAFPERLGWKEIVVVSNGISLLGDFSTTSLSNRLTNYPQDLLTNPLDQRQIQFEIASVLMPEPKGPSTNRQPAAFQISDRNDAFTRLILLDDLTPSVLLLALFVSFIWGAMHAMTPGHGKTIVGAYLVGSRGTPRHALYLGLTTTITHTAGVFGLGLLTLFASRYVVPEKLFPWMNLLSGLLVMGIGLNLAVGRFRSSTAANWLRSLKTNFTGSARFVPAVLEHGHVESPTQHKYVLNAHEHGHSHGHGLVHPHDHHRDHIHVHGDGDHSHMPPGEDGSPVTLRNLLALGISGGLLPCPSALVVLLGAIALNRIGFGLLLVFVFSLGLAGALTGIGLIFIYAGRIFERFSLRGKWIQILPVFSAMIISLIGLVILIRSLSEIGFLTN